MREIKFRAWDKTNAIMIFDDIWVHCYGSKSNLPDFHIAETPSEETYDARTDLEIMQYTGLKDKNGKEVYESDVVRILNNTTVVYYENGGFRVGSLFKSSLIYLNENNVEFEVIGNLHENPELLTKTDDK